MAWADDELWFVNTRFSCLSTLDWNHSFVARWRPPFVSALTPEDRCHLNGLGMVEGSPRYATALGATDAPAGWRADKARGGVLIDVPSGETIAAGLSMPHSPRWYAGKCPTPPHATGIIEVGRSRKGLTSITIGFDESLNPGSVGNLALYRVLGAVKKRKQTVFSKGVVIRSTSYDPSAHTLTINLAKPYKGAVQVTVRSGLVGANGAASLANFMGIAQ
jgi:uncharacterized protein (TIGR03032 family)